MATTAKTVVFSCTALASIVDATLTTVTSPTIYLPESGKTFRSCWVVVTCDDIVTATGGTILYRRVDFGLAAVTQQSVADSNTTTHSGENISAYWEVDLTSYFTTNWTGTSMTTDVEVSIDQSTGTTLGQVNVCVSIHITYEYDDTSATQVKTVWLPLAAPVGALATSKPGTATATIPALDTHLPEASKAYRQIAIWRMGNTAGASADPTVSMELDTDGASVSGIYESALVTSRWTRYIDTGVCSALDTSATASFYLWASAASFNHCQVMMQVTYEFDASAANDLFVSLMLPFDMPGGMYNSANPLVSSTELIIPEAGVSSKEIACFVNWTYTAAITTFNLRVGTGSYVTYTDGGSFYAGDSCAMVRNDSAYTLAQGSNTLAFYAYGSATIRAIGMRGFWVVNYTCDKPTGGAGAASRTVHVLDTIIGANITTASIFSNRKLIYLPDDWYYLLCVGAYVSRFNSSTTVVSDTALFASEAAGWHALLDTGYTESDGEVGANQYWSDCSDVFWRHGNDPDSTRVDPTTNFDAVQVRVAFALSRCAFGVIYSYHAQTFAVVGTVYGSAGGTVYLSLHSAVTGETLKAWTRAGDGAISFFWFWPTPDVYIDAYEDDTHVGRSIAGAAGTDTFDIVLGPRSAHAIGARSIRGVLA